jgi:hypothetical protein
MGELHLQNASFLPLHQLRHYRILGVKQDEVASSTKVASQQIELPIESVPTNPYLTLILQDIDQETIDHKTLYFLAEEQAELNKKFASEQEKELQAEEQLRKQEERQRFFDTVDKAASCGGAVLSIVVGSICLSNGDIITGGSLVASGAASLSNITGFTSWATSWFSSNPTVSAVANAAMGGIAVVGAVVGGLRGATQLIKVISVVQGGLAITLTPLVGYVNYQTFQAEDATEVAKGSAAAAESAVQTTSSAIEDQRQLDAEREQVTAEIVHAGIELINISIEG